MCDGSTIVIDGSMVLIRLPTGGAGGGFEDFPPAPPLKRLSLTCFAASISASRRCTI